MATINDAIRMSKRIILTNLLSNDYSIAVTPLISGKHGIGKSQIAKSIAKDLGGVCFTIEGGSLKEGEITGIPYQYRNEKQEIEFRFLPYYVVQRIQNAEKALAEKKEHTNDIEAILNGEENQYSVEDLTFEEKVSKLRSHEVTPVVIFFDEINRTDSVVFRELMNIILTRTVNGYRFPWWVFMIAAMNPSTQNSIYATNEMDLAQMDRFIKIKVHENANEWLEFAAENGIDKSLMAFIANHPKALCSTDRSLDDEEIPSPSPRGWSMINLIIKGKEQLDAFFTKDELSKVEKDIRAIISAKVGSDAAAMYYSSLKDNSKLVLAEDILDKNYDTIPTQVRDLIKKQSTARNTITSKSIVRYLTDHIDQDHHKPEIMNNILARLKDYMSLLDSSSRLLFAVSLTNGYSKNGTELFNYVFEIFDEELLELLQVSNLNEMKIIGG